MDSLEDDDRDSDLTVRAFFERLSTRGFPLRGDYMHRVTHGATIVNTIFVRSLRVRDDLAEKVTLIDLTKRHRGANRSLEYNEAKFVLQHNQFEKIVDLCEQFSASTCGPSSDIMSLPECYRIGKSFYRTETFTGERNWQLNFTCMGFLRGVLLFSVKDYFENPDSTRRLYEYENHEERDRQDRQDRQEELNPTNPYLLRLSLLVDDVDNRNYSSAFLPRRPQLLRVLSARLETRFAMKELDFSRHSLVCFHRHRDERSVFTNPTVIRDRYQLNADDEYYLDRQLPLTKQDSMTEVVDHVFELFHALERRRPRVASHQLPSVSSPEEDSVPYSEDGSSSSSSSSSSSTASTGTE